MSTNQIKNLQGKRKWHRIFGWVMVVRHNIQSGTVLVDSEFKHIRHFVNNAWQDYRGQSNRGYLTGIVLNTLKKENELYDAPQADDIQALVAEKVQWIK